MDPAFLSTPPGSLQVTEYAYLPIHNVRIRGIPGNEAPAHKRATANQVEVPHGRMETPANNMGFPDNRICL